MRHASYLHDQHDHTQMLHQTGVRDADAARATASGKERTRSEPKPIEELPPMPRN